MARQKRIDGEIRAGRTGPTWTDVQDWVGLAGISSEAHSLYVKLRMHVNAQRGDNKAWPGKERLAVLMSVGRGDYIDPWLGELEDLGAIDILSEGMPAHNVYVIHNLPPDGYAGPTNLAEWAAEFSGLVRLRRDAAREKTRLQRERTMYFRHATPPASYDGPVTLDEWAGLHAGEVARRADLAAAKVARAAAKAATEAAPVTGESRVQAPVTGQGREHVTGESRVEPDVLELDVEPKTPPPPAEIHPPPPSPVPVQNRGGNDSKITDQEPDPVKVLITELGRLAPRWRDLNRRVRAVLADPAVADRPPEVVRAALVELAAGKHGPTASPRRVLEDGPWWESASQRVVVAAPSPRLAAVRACDRCDPAGWALDDDGPARRCDHAVLVGAQ